MKVNRNTILKNGKDITKVYLYHDDCRAISRAPMYWAQVYTKDDVDPQLIMPMTLPKIAQLLKRVPRTRITYIVHQYVDYSGYGDIDSVPFTDLLSDYRS